AAGALEAVGTIGGLETGLLPPTANLWGPDPASPFDCIPHIARPATLDCAMSNSFGFGGHDVSLIFLRPEGVVGLYGVDASASGGDYGYRLRQSFWCGWLRPGGWCAQGQYLGDSAADEFPDRWLALLPWGGNPRGVPARDRGSPALESA